MGKKSRAKQQASQHLEQAENLQGHSTILNNTKRILWLQALVIFGVCFALYANTLSNQYAVDDTIVIVKNKLTKQGLEGIPMIMQTDAFYGFFGEDYKFVAGGRYRPLSLVTFAIEYELFGMSPGISHFNNIWLYGLTCVLIFLVLAHLFKAEKLEKFALTVPFIAALIFAAHPIHTEVVANIKGRDEIMGMLGSILALYCFLRFVKATPVANEKHSGLLDAASESTATNTRNGYLWLLGGLLAWVFALFSKENAVTYLAVVPVAFYFFTKARVKHYVLAVLPMLLLTAGYLVLRKSFTDVDINAVTTEVLNNPWMDPATLKPVSTGAKYATIAYTFIAYFKLLVFPHPLTYDYYYNQVPITNWADPIVILSVIVNLALVAYAIYGLKDKKPIAFAILYYYITLSIVSNVLFTVGIAMNERFIFMPSLGFALVVAILLVKLTNYLKTKEWSYKQVLNPRVATIILLLVLAGYTIKTVTRNKDWENDFTLFKADAKNSPNSAKVHNAYGGELVNAADSASTPALKQERLTEAVRVLNRALEIYPNYLNAVLLLGNAKYKLNNDPKEAEALYLRTLQLKPDYFEGHFNLAAVYLESKQPRKAIPHLKSAIAAKPDKPESYYNLAQGYVDANMPDSAIAVYQRLLAQSPNDAMLMYRIGTTYGRVKNDLDNAIVWLNKAIQADPKQELFYEDLSVAYGLKEEYASAVAVLERGIQVSPNYAPFYRNMVTSYTQLNQPDKVQEYQTKFEQMTAGQGQ